MSGNTTVSKKSDIYSRRNGLYNCEIQSRMVKVMKIITGELPILFEVTLKVDIKTYNRVCIRCDHPAL